MFAATPIFVLALFAETTLVPALDVVVRETDNGLEVVRVVRGGTGDSAGLKPGQYIVRLAGERVFTIDDLANALEDRGSAPLDLEVSEGKPTRGQMWLGLSASGHGWTGQPDTRSSWLGLLFALELANEVHGIAGFGYTALGKKPFVGRDAWTPLFGLHYETKAIADDFTPFGRVLIGPNLTYTDVIRPGFWDQEPLTIVAQAGLRFWWLEASLSAGWGPARNQNVGLNITLWFPLGSLFE